MSVPEGVQWFNFWTFSILGKLLDEFPRPCRFYFGRLRAVYVTSDPQTAGAPLGPKGQEQVQYFDDALEWLVDAGFVKKQAEAAPFAVVVSITEKGLAALKATPHSVKTKPGAAPTKSYSDLMREAIVSKGVGSAGTIVIDYLRTLQ